MPPQLVVDNCETESFGCFNHVRFARYKFAAVIPTCLLRLALISLVLFPDLV